MKITIKVGLICAALWIAIKMMFFYQGWNVKEKFPILVLLNILGVLLSIAIGLFLQKRKDIKDGTNDGNALRDIKNAMTAGVPYTVVISIFLYFYYAKIDPEFNQKQIAEQEMVILKTLDDPEGFKGIQESNIKYEVMTKEEIYAEMRQGPQNIYNAKFTSTVALLSMLLLSTVNSILVTVIYRRIMFKGIPN